ncbi:uncharacterized protein LOC123314706 [Coccinella septempunctata]|uniref:uncharacterized protein LOC123314706 n=1 Tax=Coccinella septempunctata TaxID=41139 RepID=UPI001D081027|nr:uncharacterized protein LOC123314706 [Coccinella septempunctata]XP_044755947.1 uncharacterized protein LOC123314706 [Coccinella septempunctata]
MTSVICQNFVQNAWKKELCSNCFKSRNEHQERVAFKPLPRLSRKIEGIIKSGKKTKLSHRSVRFPSQLTEVIGYGGEDWSSDGEEEQVDSNDDDFDDDFSDDSDETDAELRKITKANTDYNTTSLVEEADTKKSFASLMLGKPIVDSEGKKKTLLVSVKPFGEDSAHPPKKTSKGMAILRNKKESVTETNTSVILKSYTKNEDVQQEKSLLDEITETLENSRRESVQIITRKKLEQETNKENIENDNVKKEESQKSDKKVLLSRSPALKREHALLYQTTTSAKIELMNGKNSKTKIEGENKDAKKTEQSSPDNSEKEQNVDEDIVKNETAIKSGTDNGWDVTEEKINDDDKCIDSPDSSITSSSSNCRFDNVAPSQSREQAGEPDGRADPDNPEPPALPLTPPPVLLENQSSFLHSSTSANVANVAAQKPKIASKPNTVLIRKQPAMQHHHLETAKNQVLMTTFSPPDPAKQTSSDGCDVAAHISNKRRAPNPPPAEDNGGLFLRKPLNSINGECPVVREKEKRERASSCPKLPQIVGASPKVDGESVPEPAPRKILSISTDSLASMDDGRRKEKTKAKFSLKKFLRMGSNKDLTKLPVETCRFDEFDIAPTPKPRLIIVHPSELNGDKVEVVAKSLTLNQNESPLKIINDYENINIKSTKPPPPPRNIEDSQKPLTPPPKSADVLNIQKQVSRTNSLIKKEETVYANIGEVRSSIVPNKPVRTASMREREAQQQQKQKERAEQMGYRAPKEGADGNNVYEYLNGGRSSSPDSDSSREKHSPTTGKPGTLSKRSESSVDVSGDYFKYGNIPRSVSLTYCGSETESEIYSPYGFYGSESEVTEDDHEWIQNGKTHKLRSRKGRSIVHKNLEDNYGAVIVANHEALAQVLENIQQTVHIPPALRGLKTSSNLRWSDFTVKNANPLILGRRTFHQALWGTHHVTLAINRGLVPSCTLSLGTFNLNPVTEFNDLVPVKYLGETESDASRQVQATITVLPWMQVNTIQSFSNAIKSKTPAEDACKENVFIMLQLVNALKNLQAQGIEELPVSLSSFVLCKDMEKDVYQKLFVLQGLTEELSNKNEKFGTLCQCASRALQLLQPTMKINSLIQSVLGNERATSLTQVKSVLEFSLWGPSDVALGSTIRERELALQRWLDLQRATVLHGLVCTRVQLTVYEEYHLLFLVRSNARMMCDASLLLESSNMKHAVANGSK